MHEFCLNVLIQLTDYFDTRHTDHVVSNKIFSVLFNLTNTMFKLNCYMYHYYSGFPQDVEMLEKLIQDDVAAAKTPVLLVGFAGRVISAVCLSCFLQLMYHINFCLVENACLGHK